MHEMPQIEWGFRTGPAHQAGRELPSLVAAYFAYVREVLAQDPPPAELHRLRLATKRLRYTLELFRDCYGPGLEVRLRALQEVQQALGDLNDSVASRTLLKRALGSSPQGARIDKFLASRAQKQALQFRNHWVEVFDRAGREEWFAGYLSRNAQSPRK